VSARVIDAAVCWVECRRVWLVQRYVESSVGVCDVLWWWCVDVDGDSMWCTWVMRLLTWITRRQMSAHQWLMHAMMSTSQKRFPRLAFGITSTHSQHWRRHQQRLVTSHNQDTGIGCFTVLW